MSRILIVDDQKDVVDTIYDVLHGAGFTPEKAHSGKEALGKAKDADLIFLDIMMPEMDGYAVAAELRKRFNDKIKIVYISVKPKAEVDLRMVDGFIQKPFEIRDILEEARKQKVRGAE